MKILITGGDSFIGSALSKALSSQFKIFFSHSSENAEITGCTPIRIDLCKEYEITDNILYIRPDAVINCAAMTHLDRCERNRELAFSVNVHGAGIVAKACEQIRAKLVHISSSYVFDGEKGMYSERDYPHPVNYYGLTKMLSERLVKKYNRGSIILRAHVYGPGVLDRPTFLEAIVHKLRAGEKLNMPEDVLSTPISTMSLAEAIAELLEKDASGVYNIASPDIISRSQFARKVAHVFGLDESLISPVSVHDMFLPAEIGRDLSLDAEKARSELKAGLPNVVSSLIRIRNSATGRL